MVEYIVKCWYNDGYDENGVMNHVDESYQNYEDAKNAYASALECCEDSYAVELVRRTTEFCDFTMASSRREHPRRIIIDEEWLPEPGDKA